MEIVGRESQLGHCFDRVDRLRRGATGAIYIMKCRYTARYVAVAAIEIVSVAVDRRYLDTGPRYRH